MKSQKAHKALLAILPLAFVIGFFQNCTSNSLLLSDSIRSNNGRPYGGKVYANHDQACADGEVSSMIQVESPQLASLFRDNCITLSVPIALSQVDFSIDPTFDILTYGQRKFTAPRDVQKTPLAVVNNATTLSTGYSKLPSIGNTVIVLASAAATSPFTIQPGSITDNNGNLYQEACLSEGVATAPTAGYLAAHIFYAKNVQVGQSSFVVSARASSAADWSILSMEVSGLDPVQPLKQGIASSGQSYMPASANLSAATNDLIVSLFTNNDVMGALQSPSGFLSAFQQTCCGAGASGEAVFRFMPASGTQSASWWHDSGNDSYRACIASFK